MPREYETAFIVQPEISDEGRAELCARLDGVLEREGATRLWLEDWGKRKLAYEINKFQKGHYYFLSFLDDGKVVPGLERTLKLEESVLRYLTVRVADKVADVEARKAESAEAEKAQAERAAERAAREAEADAARAAAAAEAEAEATRLAEEARLAEAAEASAEGDDASSDEPSEEAAGDTEGLVNESDGDDEAPDADAEEDDESSKES